MAFFVVFVLFCFNPTWICHRVVFWFSSTPKLCDLGKNMSPKLLHEQNCAGGFLSFIHPRGNFSCPDLRDKEH